MYMCTYTNEIYTVTSTKSSLILYRYRYTIFLQSFDSFSPCMCMGQGHGRFWFFFFIRAVTNAETRVRNGSVILAWASIIKDFLCRVTKNVRWNVIFCCCKCKFSKRNARSFPRIFRYCTVDFVYYSSRISRYTVYPHVDIASGWISKKIRQLLTLNC